MVYLRLKVKFKIQFSNIPSFFVGSLIRHIKASTPPTRLSSNKSMTRNLIAWTNKLLFHIAPRLTLILCHVFSGKNPFASVRIRRLNLLPLMAYHAHYGMELTIVEIWLRPCEDAWIVSVIIGSLTSSQNYFQVIQFCYSNLIKRRIACLFEIKYVIHFMEWLLSYL